MSRHSDTLLRSHGMLQAPTISPLKETMSPDSEAKDETARTDSPSSPKSPQGILILDDDRQLPVEGSGPAEKSDHEEPAGDLHPAPVPRTWVRSTCLAFPSLRTVKFDNGQTEVLHIGEPTRCASTARPPGQLLMVVDPPDHLTMEDIQGSIEQQWQLAVGWGRPLTHAPIRAAGPSYRPVAITCDSGHIRGLLVVLPPGGTAENFRRTTLWVTCRGQQLNLLRCVSLRECSDPDRHPGFEWIHRSSHLHLVRSLTRQLSELQNSTRANARVRPAGATRSPPLRTTRTPPRRCRPASAAQPGSGSLPHDRSLTASTVGTQTYLGDTSANLQPPVAQRRPALSRTYPTTVHIPASRPRPNLSRTVAAAVHIPSTLEDDWVRRRHRHLSQVISDAEEVGPAAVEQLWHLLFVDPDPRSTVDSRLEELCDQLVRTSEEQDGVATGPQLLGLKQQILLLHREYRTAVEAIGWAAQHNYEAGRSRDLLDLARKADFRCYWQDYCRAQQEVWQYALQLADAKARLSLESLECQRLRGVGRRQRQTIQHLKSEVASLTEGRFLSHEIFGVHAIRRQTQLQKEEEARQHSLTLFRECQQARRAQLRSEEVLDQWRKRAQRAVELLAPRGKTRFEKEFPDPPSASDTPQISDGDVAHRTLQWKLQQAESAVSILDRSNKMATAKHQALQARNQLVEEALQTQVDQSYALRAQVQQLSDIVQTTVMTGVPTPSAMQAWVDVSERLQYLELRLQEVGATWLPWPWETRPDLLRQAAVRTGTETTMELGSQPESALDPDHSSVAAPSNESAADEAHGAEITGDMDVDMELPSSAPLRLAPEVMEGSAPEVQAFPFWQPTPTTEQDEPCEDAMPQFRYVSPPVTVPAMEQHRTPPGSIATPYGPWVPTQETVQLMTEAAGGPLEEVPILPGETLTGPRLLARLAADQFGPLEGSTGRRPPTLLEADDLRPVVPLRDYPEGAFPLDAPGPGKQ